MTSAGTLIGFAAIVAVEQLEVIDTSTLFRSQPAEGGSPLDRFLASTTKLNLIYMKFGSEGIAEKPELASLVVLGYMSAVESYVRAIITGLINTDELSRRLVAEKPVSFASATAASDQRRLPEALMEHLAFSTDGSIKTALENFLGLKNLSHDVRVALDEFKKLCEVRHCCVHRFGKLGSKNAIGLGFDSHRDLIEMPFAPSLEDVERISASLLVLVKTLNNFVFREVLERTVSASLDKRQGWTWTWRWERDRRRFTAYYDLFACRLEAPVSAAPREVYGSFKAAHAARVAAHARRPPGVRPEASTTS